MQRSTSRQLVRRSLLGFLTGAAILAGAATVEAIEFESITKALTHTTAELRALASELETALAGVSYDVRHAVSDGLSAILGLADSMDRALRDSVHTFTNALSTALTDVLTQGQLLLADLRRGILEVVGEASRVLRQVVDRAFAQLAAALDETLRHAENIGGRLVLRASNAAHVGVISVLGAVLAIVGAVGSIRQIRRRPGAEGARSSRVAAAVLASLVLGGIGLVVGSRFIAREVGTTVELPDGNTLCADASKKGAELRAALAMPARVASVLRAGLPREVTWFVAPGDVVDCDPSKSISRLPGKNFFPPVLPEPLSSPTGRNAGSPVSTAIGASASRPPSEGAMLLIADESRVRPVLWRRPLAGDVPAGARVWPGEVASLQDPLHAASTRSHEARFNAGVAAFGRACAAFQERRAGDVLRGLVQGGADRRIVDRAQAVTSRARPPGFTGAGTTAPATPPSEAQKRVDVLAAAAKEAALLCITYAGTRQQADEAREVHALASDYLGDPIRCVADRDCPADKLCRVSTGECLAKGFYCRSPSDCRAGSECDPNHEECVSRDGFACSRNEQCRAGEACLSSTRRCVDIEAYAGRPCTVTDAVRHKGLCFSTPGIWASVGAGLECRPSYAPRADDTCDGQDNDCDGTVDEEYRPGEVCFSPDGSIHGECVRGSKECRDGRERCRPSPAMSEACDDGKDNDCDGATDEGCQRPGPELCNGADDDLNGAVDDAVACHTVVLFLSEIDDDAYLWSDRPGKKEDALCTARFSGGQKGSAECNLSALVGIRRLPASGRFVLKFGNGGCWGSSGIATLVIDGKVVWTKRKPDAIRHCGWFYRKSFDLDFAHGVFVNGDEHECRNDGECPN